MIVVQYFCLTFNIKLMQDVQSGAQTTLLILRELHHLLPLVHYESTHTSLRVIFVALGGGGHCSISTSSRWRKVGSPQVQV